MSSSHTYILYSSMDELDTTICPLNWRDWPAASNSPLDPRGPVWELVKEYQNMCRHAEVHFCLLIRPFVHLWMSANASRDDDSFDITWPGDGVETSVDEAWDRLFEFIPECLVIQEYDLIEDRTWKMFKHMISALDHNIRAIECFKISCNVLVLFNITAFEEGSCTSTVMVPGSEGPREVNVYEAWEWWLSDACHPAFQTPPSGTEEQNMYYYLAQVFDTVSASCGRKNFEDIRFALTNMMHIQAFRQFMDLRDDYTLFHHFEPDGKYTSTIDPLLLSKQATSTLHYTY